MSFVLDIPSYVSSRLAFAPIGGTTCHPTLRCPLLSDSDTGRRKTVTVSGDNQGLIELTCYTLTFRRLCEPSLCLLHSSLPCKCDDDKRDCRKWKHGKSADDGSRSTEKYVKAVVVKGDCMNVHNKSRPLIGIADYDY